MDLILVRSEFRADGIFGGIHDNFGNHVLNTLEHAYLDPTIIFAPKMPDGVYTCIRGMHKLEHSIEPFETFEITGVPGHDNILFHTGNFNSDSHGCVLVGLDIGHLAGQRVLSNSRAAFAKLMKLQQGMNSFILTVKSD